MTNMMPYQILPSSMHGKKKYIYIYIKKSYKNNEFKIPFPKWNNIFDGWWINFCIKYLRLF